MSSLFSIGEDEMDLDDEDCLLAACVTGSSVHWTTNNSQTNSVLQQDKSTDSSKTQLLRTVEKFNGHYSRRPFESHGNINTSGRVSEKKKPSTEQMHRSFSFASRTVLQRNNTTSSANGFHAPLTKRFAFDNNSSPLSENRASLLRSSSTPSIKTAESPIVVHSSDKIYQCNSSPFQRNISSRDSQSQEISKCILKPGDSLESNKRLNPSSKASMPYNSTSNCLSKKNLSVPHSPNSSAGFRSFHNSNATESMSPVWQQRGAFRCTPAMKGPIGNSSSPIDNTSSFLCNQTKRHSANTLHGNLNGNKGSENTLMSRQSGHTGSNTPQGHQAVTPIVNRSHSRTPSVSKTPTSRKFPGPAGLLPKLSPGQRLDDTSLVSPPPSMRKKSPVEDKVQVSQSNTSEDDDFNRDPWTCMHQDFLKNVPLAKRYTIIKVYNEAIQQRLEQGKVPCLCALVKAFSLTEADASVLLKDPTGEIHGTLHRKVMEDFQTELAPGAGLILKHVSVFSPAPRKHYLNITPGNILQIYPPDPQFTSSQTLASQCTPADNEQEQQSQMMEMSRDVWKSSPNVIAHIEMEAKKLQLDDELRRKQVGELKMFSQKEKENNDRVLWTRWIKTYKLRLDQECDKVDAEEVHQERVRTMKSNNPSFVLRNYIAQRAIQTAEKGDYSVVQSILKRLETPYSDDMEDEEASFSQTVTAESSPSLVEHRERTLFNVRNKHENFRDRPPEEVLNMRLS